jgi:hypothetical protein
MMTLRADLESPGDAPVFDDSEKLLEYLKAHSGLACLSGRQQSPPTLWTRRGGGKGLRGT